MKISIFFVIFLALSNLALGCDKLYEAGKPLSFNIGEKPHVVFIKNGKGIVSLGGGMVDHRGTVTINKANSTLTVSIPSLGINQTGKYGGLEKCFDTPLTVTKWDDSEQESFREKMFEELRWIGNNPRFELYQSPTFKIYVADEAKIKMSEWELEYSWSQRKITLPRNRSFSLQESSQGKPNKIVFINYDEENDVLSLTGEQMDGKELWYWLDQYGNYADMNKKE